MQEGIRYELAADAMDSAPASADTTAQQREITISEQNDTEEHFKTLSGQEPGEDLPNSARETPPQSLPQLGESTPLLTTSIRTAGDSPSSWWLPPLHQQQQKENLNHRQRLCRLSLLAAVVVALLTCIYLASIRRDVSFNHAPPLPITTYLPTNRTYERHETTSDITGGYRLYDKVSLSTTTGNIDIELDPQPVEDSSSPLLNNNAAHLFLRSDTGTINLRLASSYISNPYRPTRPIIAEIRTATGQINAQLPLTHAGSLEITTTTGQQILSIYYIDSDSDSTAALNLHNNHHSALPSSTLTTRSTTGSQHLTLHALNSHHPITALIATHHSQATANLHILYPPTWHGIIDATTTAAVPMTGLSVTGADLVYEVKDDHCIRARRGTERNDALIRISSDGTGEVEFRC